ncbi:hypothetical protein ElyMa_006762000 [Elysia marginata]|uniref:Secreted protein n=1 Tax=Elysia marginata TaxID=1093978 RepID=A0AAV4J189_9GAST|nr:hypothetical protein ElyMa_006762000 [Elysia marginata]
MAVVGVIVVVVVAAAAAAVVVDVVAEGVVVDVVAERLVVEVIVWRRVLAAGTRLSDRELTNTPTEEISLRTFYDPTLTTEFT